MRINVIGIGYVGAVTSACLCKSGHHVTAVDTSADKVNAINNGRPPIIEKDLAPLIKNFVDQGQLKATNNIFDAIKNSDISLICVGTPSKEDGSLDLKYVRDVCEDIGNALKNIETFHTVVLRSTMLPNSAKSICLPIIENASGKKAGIDFGFGNNPEFLREGSAIEDYFNPPKIVVGANDQKSAEIIMSLYEGIEAPRIQTEIKIAEGVKYADNAWHAMKIGFANEIGNILSDNGVDSHKVMDIFCQDRKLNISSAYLKPGFAFGGSCLPKDVRAIRALGVNMGVSTPLFDSLMTANDNQIMRAFNKIKAQKVKNITLLGLSFKAGTDDVRESPLVTLAEKLINEGLNVTIFDPNVIYTYNFERSNIIKPQHFVKKVSNNSDLYVIGNNSAAFIDIIKDINAPILDLVRLHPDIEQQEGYSGICW
jgi:GDP-mannose 6-dehydrogenase